MGKKEEELSEEELIQRTKKLSIVEGSAHSFMDGFGTKYVSPYALSVGANSAQIGLLSALPSLVGSISQLFSFSFMKKFERKKIIFWGVFLQSLMWVFLILAGIPFFVYGIKTNLSPNLVIFIYILLFLFGAFISPVWNSLMKDVVSKKRGEYFGRRSQILGIVALFCMLSASFILDYFKQTKAYLGFVVIFFIAGIGRMVSSLILRKHYDPPFRTDDSKYFSFIEFAKKMKNNNFGRFVLYFSLVSFAYAISSPFFVIYLLEDLGFSYIQYTIILVFNAMATLIFVPIWGKFADRYGSVKVMKITGFSIPFLALVLLAVPLATKLLPALIFLIITESYAGFIWAGFNLAASNFIYDAVTKERTSICIAYFNLMNSVLFLVGSSIGGFLSFKMFTLFGLGVIPTLFLLSFIARFLVHLIYSRNIKEVREVKPYKPSKKSGVLRSLALSKFFETKDQKV